MKKISLFSDGSSLGNPGPGGYCTILRYKDNEKILKGGMKNTTNNIMELRGVIEGIKHLNEPCDITIYSDSKYVLDGLSKWIFGWIKNGWQTASKKPVKNVELWKEYYIISQKHKITPIWVKGHNGHEENEKCDQIAREEASLQKLNYNG